MGRLQDAIRKNRLYVALAAFLILINLLVLADRMAAKKEVQEQAVSAEQAEPAEEEGVERVDPFSEEEIKAREEKITALAGENPTLYFFLGVINLTILFLILIGIILDGYFILRWMRKDPVRPKAVPQEPPRWTVGDVVRVILIFLSFGYVFVIFQSFVADVFPLLRNENFIMVLNTALMNIVGISVILYFIVKKYGQSINAVGLSAKNFTSNVFCAAVGYISLIPVLLVIMIITFFVIKWLKYKPPVQPIVQVFMEEKETAILWFSSLFAAIFGPVAEEIFFRGFMYTALKRRIGIFWGMLITSVVFSFLHAHVVGFFPILALGLLLAYLYEKTGSLVSSMSVHIAHNVAMVVLVFMVRGIGV